MTETYDLSGLKDGEERVIEPINGRIIISPEVTFTEHTDFTFREAFGDNACRSDIEKLATYINDIFGEKSMDINNESFSLNLPNNWREKTDNKFHVSYEIFCLSKDGSIHSIPPSLGGTHREFFELVQKKFGRQAVVIENGDINVDIPESAPAAFKKRYFEITKQKETKEENPYYLLQEHIFKNYEIEYNVFEDMTTIITDIQKVVDNIVKNEDFSVDIQAIHNKDFESVSERFKTDFIDLISMQIRVWQDGNKSHKKQLAKDNKKIPGNLKDYLQYVSDDSKKEKIISTRIDNETIRSLINEDK